MPSRRGSRRAGRAGRDLRRAVHHPARAAHSRPARPRTRAPRRTARELPERAPVRERGHPPRLAVAAVALAALAFLWALFQPFAGEGGDRVRVDDPQAGRASARSATSSTAKDVVPSAAAVRAAGARSPATAATSSPASTRCAKDMSYGDVLDRLVAGPATGHHPADDPRGPGRGGDRAARGRAGVRGDYLQATRRVPVGSAAAYGAQASAREPRGLPVPGHLRAAARRDAATALVAKQLAAFEQQLRAASTSRMPRKNLTPYDVDHDRLDGRARDQLARERPLVAAVIYNRLHAGQPLGIDATIRYATGNWTEPLTKSELALDSPYNTRTDAGPAADPDRQSRPGLDRGRGPPGARRLPLLRGEAGHLRRARLLEHVRASSSATSSATTPPARRPAASRRPPASREA